MLHGFIGESNTVVLNAHYSKCCSYGHATWVFITELFGCDGYFKDNLWNLWV